MEPQPDAMHCSDAPTLIDEKIEARCKESEERLRTIFGDSVNDELLTEITVLRSVVGETRAQVQERLDTAKRELGTEELARNTHILEEEVSVLEWVLELHSTCK